MGEAVLLQNLNGEHVDVHVEDQHRPLRVDIERPHVDLGEGEHQVGHQRLLEDLHHDVQLLMLVVEPLKRAERQSGLLVNLAMLIVELGELPIDRPLRRSRDPELVAAVPFDRFRRPSIVLLLESELDALLDLPKKGQAGVVVFGQG